MKQEDLQNIQQCKIQGGKKKITCKKKIIKKIKICLAPCLANQCATSLAKWGDQEKGTT